MPSSRTLTRSFEFTLILSGVETLSEELANSVYESGCDDCLPVSTGGKVYLDFSRKASSREAAIDSAMSSLRSAGFKPEVLQE
jgi:hypothetical protein